jgi:hypothetical protein
MSSRVNFRTWGIIVFLVLLQANILMGQYRIMPLGDGITEGATSGDPAGGYRDDLDALVDGAGIPVNFVGTLSTGSGFDTEHEGHNGFRADQIDANFNSWYNQLGSSFPRIFLLHIGTVDISENQSNSETIQEIENIVNKIHAQDNTHRILLSSLIPRNDEKNEQTYQLNNLILNLYNQKLSAGYRIYYVGNYEVFISNPNWATEYMETNILPNNTGYSIMAQVFFNYLANIVGQEDASVTDNFIRATRGPTWVADPAYQIVSNELSNTATNGVWEGFLATFAAQPNPTKVGITWGAGADNLGTGEGAIAMKLDAPSTTASGYMCWYSASGIRFWELINGDLDQSTQLEMQQSQFASPTAGDKFEIVMSSDENGNHFEVYLNGALDVTFTDAQKRQGNQPTNYAGVFLKGNLNNNISSFELSGIALGPIDDTPPDAVNTLNTGAVTQHSITLSWTATGDDGAVGTAAQYDVRHALTPIENDNDFSNATEATGEPVPSTSGSQESFDVTGLPSGTTHYFALKVIDDGFNTSALSNSVSATTVAGETISPAAVTNLNAVSATGNTITISWTAVGDDGMVGTASSYEVRYSTEEIVTDNDFNAATPANGEPTPAPSGTQETFVVTGLQMETMYYIAMKVLDEELNVSPLSNVVNMTTLRSQVVYITDNFNRASLGDNWIAIPDYQIVNNELANTSTIDNWGLAIHKQAANVVDAAFKWGVQADAGGIEQGGLALRMDDLSTEASGYLAWIRPSRTAIKLFTIINGGVGDAIGSEIQIAAGASVPTAGSIFKVEPRSDAGGHHFDFYVDDQFAGTITDAAKQFGNSETTYAGVYLRGNLSNNLDDFTFGLVGEAEGTPPAAVSDLVAASSTGSSITVNWTATGDDGTSGTATNYDVRYSTSPINSDNDFNAATQANGEPIPAVSGTPETFTIYGLQPNVLYYVALKVEDDAANVSTLSNVVSISTVATTTIYFDDNFNRGQLGDNWVASPEYQIDNDELTNSSPSYEWGYLAVYKPATSPFEVSFKWGVQASEAGISEGGFAVKLDSLSTTASGYFVWIRSDNQTLNLYRLEDGTPAGRIGNEVPMQAGASVPQADSLFKVEISTDGNGHHIDCFVGDQLAGRISDPDKLYGNTEPTYAGVYLRGGLDNNVDDFRTAEIGVADVTSPANISNLSVSSTSGTGAILQWSAVGDDGNDGTASSYDVRYSTSPINDIGDFNQATPVSNEPLPSSPGTQESFSITGLESNTTYYFAVKVIDEAGNFSLSNSASGTTEAAFVYVDNFNRTTLGADWNTDPEYQIVNNELANTATTYIWGYLAVLTARQNPLEVSFQWGANATSQGIEEGGMALRLNQSNPNASGYSVGIRPSKSTIVLFLVESGNTTTKVGEEIPLEQGCPIPQAGDVFKIQLGSDGGGHHFDCYVNDIFAGRVSDPNKFYGNAEELYCGLNLRGDRSNNIDNFSVMNLGGTPTFLDYVTGDDQFGKIGAALPGSLEVRVTDQNGIPVADINVNYQVVQGDARLDLEPEDPDDNIRIEAESGTITPNFQIGESTNASGGKYISAPSGNAREGRADYTVRLTAGIYFIWGRIYAPSNTEDSFFYQLDNGPEYQWGLGDPFNTWRWARFEDSDNNVFEQYISGTHTFSIIKRENNSRIDKFIFTTDPLFVPSGKEESELYMTDASGLAKAELTFGNTPGTVVVHAEVEGLQGSPVIFDNLVARAGDATQIELVSGSPQEGVGGQPLAEPLVVRCLDIGNNPVEGWTVTFEEIQGGGFPSNSQPVLTDASGQASTTWTLGTEGVNNVIHAKSTKFDGSDLDGSPVVFTATASGGIAQSLVYVNGNNQSAKVNQVLAAPLKMKVVDGQNAAIKNHRVIFKVLRGGGTLSDFPRNKLKSRRNDDDALEAMLNQKEVFTDNNGFAQVTFTLGDTAGVESQVVEVSAMGENQQLSGSPYLFKATANPGNPSILKYVSGRTQTGAIGMPLGNPFIVQVTDLYGNGIAAHSVTFEVKQGGGSLSPSGPWLTEAGGYASVTLTMGTTAGVTNEVWATSFYNGVQLTDSPVEFTATPGVVSQLQKVSGDDQTGSANYPLNDSLKVKVLDNFGNPVSGYPVTFTSIGSLNPGTFNGTGNQQINVNTNTLGIAKVSLTCGPLIGKESRAQAIVDGAQGSPQVFTATVVGLDHLVFVSGSPQTGPVGTALSQPFKVKALDQLGKSQPKVPVTFTVISGSGKFSGNTSIAVETDQQTHEAAATLTLGPNQGTNNNVAHATAVYNGVQVGSPVQFTASGTMGAANQLDIHSGNNKRVAVGNPLSEPLVVKVTDRFGNPIPGHKVIFEVKTGDGTLDGNTWTEREKITDSDGLALVTLTVGPIAGVQNNSVEAVAYYVGTQDDLVNSPVTFHASGLHSAATNIAYVSGNGQPTSAVRSALAQPFRVKITDVATNVVSEHPVNWVATQGDGTFGNLLETTTTTYSDNNGIAEVVYYPGSVAGLRNKVEARSSNGPELNGSPQTFIVETKAAAVSATLSKVEATSPVAADNIAQSVITVTLIDDYNNKVQGESLAPLVSGFSNTVTPFTAETDAAGQAIAYLASTKAELKEITIIVISSGSIVLQDTAYVQFLPLAAENIEYVDGSNQQSNFGTGCKDPLLVQVTDKHDNAIPGHNVIFEVYQGGGYIFDAQPVQTGGDGIASARWVLGPEEEVNRARATADGIADEVPFIATGNHGTATALEYISGKDQTGTAGKQLPDPLVVQVVDAEGDPIYNHKVKFNVEVGGGLFNRKSSDNIYTDVFGNATGYFVLGKVAGPNIASAEADGLTGSPRRFTATGNAGPAEKMVKYAGENSTVQVYRSRWISVLITDIFDNPVANYSVQFSVLTGDATIQPGYENAISNADGIASTQISGGATLGKIEVIVLAPELIGDGMIFNISVVSQVATVMEKIPTTDLQQGTVGRELVYPLSVVVKDALGNPAGGQNIAITFALTGDHGVLLDQLAYTDENGIASARLQLQQVTGNQYFVWAINNALAGSPLQFNAIGVTNNYPLYSDISDYTINEKQTISFSVQATDGDGDPVTYGIRNLPAGAQFDSTGSRQFSWTPEDYQAGTYVVNFMAWDNNGGFDDEPVTITVENVNNPPQITYHEPQAYNIAGHLSEGEIFSFMVQVSDKDGDPIEFHWYNDDLLVSTKNFYYCKVAEQSLGSHIIKIEVSDGYDTDTREWLLSIKVPVELASFSGKVVERKGIELNWETTVEVNNAGFNIFRKSSKDTEYEKINFRIIQPNESKEYSYFDKDVKVGEYYKYKLEDVSLTGERVMHDPIELFVTKPEKYMLSQNYPNPFNAITHIRYETPEQSHVSIRIYNLLGQQVITLADEVKEAGYHMLMWDGLDKHGNLVGSGIYYYRIVSGSFNQTRKMVLLK